MILTGRKKNLQAGHPFVVIQSPFWCQNQLPIEPVKTGPRTKDLRMSDIRACLEYD